MKKGNWHISPEENERRMNLYKQGYTDTQMARILGCHPGTIQSWRAARGLLSNAKQANPSDFRNGGWEVEVWEFEVGDLLRVGIPKGQGGTWVKWHNGVVMATYPRFAVVQLERYRITVSRWDIRSGNIRIKKLERKAG